MNNFSKEGGKVLNIVPLIKSREAASGEGGGGKGEIVNLIPYISNFDLNQIQADHWCWHKKYLLVWLTFKVEPSPASFRAFQVWVKFKGWPRIINFFLTQYQIEGKKCDLLFQPRPGWTRLLIKILRALGYKVQKIVLLAQEERIIIDSF